MFAFPHDLVLAVETDSLRLLTLNFTRKNGSQGVSRPIRNGWVVIGEIGLGLRGNKLVAWLRDTSQLPPHATEKPLDFPETVIMAGTLSAMILIVLCQWHPSGKIQELETELLVLRHMPA